MLQLAAVFIDRREIITKFMVMRTKSGPDVIALSYCLHQLKPLYYTFVKKTVLLNVLLNYCHVDRFVNKL